jgi:hypothetical protein
MEKRNRRNSFGPAFSTRTRRLGPAANATWPAHAGRRAPNLVTAHGGATIGGEQHDELGCDDGQSTDRVAGTHRARIGRQKLTKVMEQCGGGDLGWRSGDSTVKRRFGGQKQ